mmetsp:Transcript_31396/g.45797  ORF Transcript_31396/g.45797 Transcript_31396/m.45797 type:complete len:248 (-) Transcript_31396:173-916(-)
MLALLQIMLDTFVHFLDLVGKPDGTRVVPLRPRIIGKGIIMKLLTRFTSTSIIVNGNIAWCMSRRCDSDSAPGPLNHGALFSICLAGDKHLQGTDQIIWFVKENICQNSLIHSIPLIRTNRMNILYSGTAISNLSKHSQIHGNVVRHAAAERIPHPIIRCTIFGIPTKVSLHTDDIPNASSVHNATSLLHGWEEATPHTLHKEHVLLPGEVHQQLCLVVVQSQRFLDESRLLRFKTHLSQLIVGISN